MHELTTHNMPQYLITAADDLARTIPKALDLITDPDAYVNVGFPYIRAMIDGAVISIEASYDGYEACATFRFLNGIWTLTYADANNPAMRAIVLSVIAKLSDDGIIPPAEYSVAVNRLMLSTTGMF